MKYAIITQEKFWHLRQGADITISNKFLLLSGEKILIFVGRLSNDEKKLVAQKYKCKVFTFFPVLYNCVRLIRFVLRRIHLNVFYFLKRPFRFSLVAKRKVTKILEKEHCDAVICEYIWLYSLALPNSKKLSRCLKIIETHDIQYLLCEQCKSKSKALSVYVKQHEEIEIYKKFDVVCCVSHPDILYFSKFMNNLCYLPPIYEAKNNPSLCGKPRLSLGFIGGSAQFNVDSVNWFICNVFGKLNDVELNVYGKVCGLLEPNQPRVYLHGPVDDIDEVYLGNHVMINPTFISGGIKTKNLEALSYGKVVLTTPDGARGLDEFVKMGYVVVCNDANSFIAAINCIKTKLDQVNKDGSAIISAFAGLYSIGVIKQAEKLFENKAH